MAQRRRRGVGGGRRQGGGSPAYSWVGIQINSTTDIPTAGVVAVLVGQGTIERAGALVLERIRGTIQISNDDTDSANGGVTVGLKVMPFEIDDAGVIAGDHNALDTDLEDIGARILWQDISHLGADTATDFQATERYFDLDVKARVKMSHPKMNVGVLLDASVANRARFICNLRALVRHK